MSRVVLHRAAPRGILKVDERKLACLRMVEEGTHTRAQLAELYGKPKGTIQSWIEEAREARQDEKNRAALARTG